MSRKVSRKHAFMVVYQMPFHSDFNLEEITDMYLREIDSVSAEDRKFIVTETSGVLAHLQEIDELISKHVEGWSFERLSKIDLAIMRLCIYELKYESDIPTGVSINEAVELCKVYGDDDAPAFVNGVLAKVATVLGSEKD